jgi:hypothetical protein
MLIDVLITLLVCLIIFVVLRYAVGMLIPDPGVQQMVLTLLGLLLLLWVLMVLVGYAPGLYHWRVR